MTEKKTGRPATYTEEQVLQGIGIVEENGDIPTGDAVKKAMCIHLDIPAGINAQSLDKEVQRLIEERERRENARLVAALPDTSREAAREICASVESAVLTHLGREHDGLRRLNEQKVAARDLDLANQREHIRDLLKKLDLQAEEISKVETSKRDLEGLLIQSKEENDGLKARIAELEKQQDFREEMLSFMKDALAQHAPYLPEKA